MEARRRNAKARVPRGLEGTDSEPEYVSRTPQHYALRHATIFYERHEKTRVGRLCFMCLDVSDLDIADIFEIELRLNLPNIRSTWHRLQNKVSKSKKMEHAYRVVSSKSNTKTMFPPLPKPRLSVHHAFADFLNDVQICHYRLVSTQSCAARHNQISRQILRPPARQLHSEGSDLEYVWNHRTCHLKFHQFGFPRRHPSCWMRYIPCAHVLCALLEKKR